MHLNIESDEITGSDAVPYVSPRHAPKMGRLMVTIVDHERLQQRGIMSEIYEAPAGQQAQFAWVLDKIKEVLLSENWQAAPKRSPEAVRKEEWERLNTNPT
jgi:hypothetical protein